MGGMQGEETQVLCKFVTRMPEEYRVTSTAIAVPATLTRYGLSEVVNHLLNLGAPSSRGSPRAARVGCVSPQQHPVVVAHAVHTGPPPLLHPAAGPEETQPTHAGAAAGWPMDSTRRGGSVANAAAHSAALQPLQLSVRGWIGRTETPRPFDFIVDGQLVRGTLEKLILDKQLSAVRPLSSLRLTHIHPLRHAPVPGAVCEPNVWP
jgi:hypothetical protein